MNRITVLRNLIWSYEALANPTPEDTQEHEENKEELHHKGKAYKGKLF